MGYAFISYSSKNIEIAKELEEQLNYYGIETWRDESQLYTSAEYLKKISKAIKKCSCFILLLSKESQKAPFVLNELNNAITNGKTIFPINIDGVKLNDAMSMCISIYQIASISSFSEMTDEIKSLFESISEYTNGIGGKRTMPDGYPNDSDDMSYYSGEYTKLTEDLEFTGLPSDMQKLCAEVHKIWSTMYTDSSIRRLVCLADKMNNLAKKYDMYSVVFPYVLEAYRVSQMSWLRDEIISYPKEIKAQYKFGKYIKNIDSEIFDFDSRGHYDENKRIFGIPDGYTTVQSIPEKYLNAKYFYIPKNVLYINELVFISDLPELVCVRVDEENPVFRTANDGKMLYEVNTGKVLWQYKE